MFGKTRRQRGAIPVALLFVAALLRTVTAAPSEPLGGAPAPSLWLSPLEFQFGVVPVGQSAKEAVTVRNSGNAPLYLDGGAPTPPFAVDIRACAGGIPAGGSCEIVYSFTPRSPEHYQAVSNGTSNAGAWSVRLHGLGAAPLFQLTPRSLDFGGGEVGSDFAPQAVTLTNHSQGRLEGFKPGPSVAPFAVETGECPQGLAPGQSCTLRFDFRPTEAGVYSRRWTATTNAGLLVVDLTGRTFSGIEGTGQRVTPRSLDFGPVRVGQASATQIISFYNQDPSIPILNWDFWWGSGSPPFQYSHNCPPVLPGHSGCQLFIKYVPTAARHDEAILTMLNTQGIIDFRLQGSAVGPQVMPREMIVDMGAPDPDTGESTSQTVSFLNEGQVAVSLGSLGISPPFTANAGNCAGTLAPGASCRATVRFDPAADGRLSGTLTLPAGSDQLSVRIDGGTVPPELGLAFVPDVVDAGARTRLRLIITNRDAGRTLFEGGIDATLPDGLVVASSTLDYLPGCGRPALFASIGARRFVLRDATQLAGSVCVMEVQIEAQREGVFTFSAHAGSSAGDSATASAQLAVRELKEGALKVYMPLASGGAGQ